MRLYVLRHGRAEDPDQWHGDEAARPLTAQGREEMRAAARGLARLGLEVEQVLCSPLARTRETAALVAQALGAPLAEEQALAPGCTLHALATLLGRHRAGELLVVGHQPDLGEIIGALIASGKPAQVHVKPGTCCCIEVAGRADGHLRGQGTLRWHLTAPQLGLIGGAT